MLNQVRNRHGYKETEITVELLKKYDIQKLTNEQRKQMHKEVNGILAIMGKTNEDHNADLISLVCSYLIIDQLQNNKN